MWWCLSSKCWVSPACMSCCQKPSQHPMHCQSSTSLSPVTPFIMASRSHCRNVQPELKKEQPSDSRRVLNPAGRLAVGHGVPVPTVVRVQLWTLILEAKGSGDVLQLAWKPYLQLMNLVWKAVSRSPTANAETVCIRFLSPQPAIPPSLASPIRGNVTPFFPCLFLLFACNVSSSTGGI